MLNLAGLKVPDAVFVKTYDHTGADADESFHLAVFC
jgi:hypothetical protein